MLDDIKALKDNARIFVAEAALQKLLENGITPDLFPDFNICVLEDSPEIGEIFFDTNEVRKYSDRFVVIISRRVVYNIIEWLKRKTNTPRIIINTNKKLQKITNCGLMCYYEALQIPDKRYLIGIDLGPERKYLEMRQIWIEIIKEMDDSKTINLSSSNLPVSKKLKELPKWT